LSADIAVVTDSTAYISEEEVSSLGIKVVPLTVNFEDHSMEDGLLDSKEFFKKVDAATKIPFTSQPSVGQFKECYEDLLAQGKEIISIHISSKISGTTESALNAARMVGEKNISVVDSEQTVEPLAFLVRAAVEWAQQGLSRKEIVERLDQEKKKIKTMFIPETLEYLKKGGRIGGAQALLGSLLQIKPVLYLNEGMVDTLDKVRTRKKAINRMLEEIPHDASKLKLVVLHALAENEAVELKERLAKEIPHAELSVAEVGPVISVHSGPLIGIGCWPQG